MAAWLGRDDPHCFGFSEEEEEEEKEQGNGLRQTTRQRPERIRNYNREANAGLWALERAPVPHPWIDLGCMSMATAE